MNTQKKIAATLAVTAAVGAAVAGGFATRPAQAHPLAAARPETHPTMLAALRSLAIAERDLNVSSHDFGGHRLKALALTQQAMSEIRIGIKYDTDHPGAK